jgi:cell division protein FtsB
MDPEPGKTLLGPRVWVALAVVAGLLILGDLNRRMASAVSLEQQAAQAATDVVALQTENARLATQLAAATNDAMVEQWARREVKMIRPGDHLVIPIPPPGQTVAPGAQATPAPPLPGPWEIWRALLLGL